VWRCDTQLERERKVVYKRRRANARQQIKRAPVTEKNPRKQEPFLAYPT
jgi:hypothetical protein